MAEHLNLGVSVCVSLLYMCVGSWEGHPEVADMMRLQRVGLKQVPEGKGHEEEEEDEEEESSSNDDRCGGLKQPTSTANRFAELNILDSCDS